MIKLFKVALVALVVGLFTGCGNPYMQVDTPEYNSHTKKLVEALNINSIKNGDSEFMNDKFESATLKLNVDSKRAEFTFKVDRARVEESMKDWKAKHPDLEVTRYNVVVTAEWELIESGIMDKLLWGDFALKFKDIKHNLVIGGSGENFTDGYSNVEKTKFYASNAIGGGLGNLLADTSKSSTGGIHPMINEGYQLKFEDNGISLKTIITVIPTRTLTLNK